MFALIKPVLGNMYLDESSTINLYVV